MNELGGRSTAFAIGDRVLLRAKIVCIAGLTICVLHAYQERVLNEPQRPADRSSEERTAAREEDEPLHEGEAIKRLLSSRRLHQVNLAHETGLSPATVSRALRRQRLSDEYWLKFSEALRRLQLNPDSIRPSGSTSMTGAGVLSEELPSARIIRVLEELPPEPRAWALRAIVDPRLRPFIRELRSASDEALNALFYYAQGRLRSH